LIFVSLVQPRRILPKPAQTRSGRKDNYYPYPGPVFKPSAPARSLVTSRRTVPSSRADREAVHGSVYSGDKGNFYPRPIPEKILSDQEAITRLWALNPNIGDRACMQLLCVGAQPPYSSTPADMRWAAEPMGVVMTATDPPAFNGRWVWRLLGVRGGALAPGMMSPNRHTEFLYIDAVTGAALSRASGPLPEPYRFGDKPSAPRTRLLPRGLRTNPSGP
jgi:hypothetical protein